MRKLIRELFVALLWSIAAVCLLLLAGYICIPDRPGSRTSKVLAIIANLRQIDSAKQEWALEHNQTNDVVVTAQDIASYFRNGVIEPVAGERYIINTLWKEPEAEFTRKLDESGRHYPKGALIRMDGTILPEPWK